jgi:toxin ParE1/3/4
VAANAFIHELESKFEPLCHAPEMGEARDYLQTGMRAFPYRKYVIYYAPTDDELIIVRVLHGARDARAIFGR